MSWTVAGIDVGGTFTDLVVVEEGSGRVEIVKHPSTPHDPSEAVLAAIASGSHAPAGIDLIVHGTTATTNAVLERQLARVGMITTRGFRDVIELGRRTRPTPYGLFGRFEPVVPRDLRFEVPERIEATGHVRVPLDEGAVEAAARTLLAMGCEALVIHFVHACANPEHELRAGAVVREVWPNDHVTLGHALVSEAREFERGVTAAVNAAVQPVLERYVERLREGLARGGYRRDYLVMNGNGGTVSSRLVAREAARTVMSGPAAGVIAAARLGGQAGFERLITYDMGGTSTDVAFVEDGRPLISDETEIEYAMPIHVPMVDVRTIGAGGGSIARVDEAGLLQVGPRSAGSTPGPICFGRGGAAPTVTDANVVLGRLSLDDLTGVEEPSSMRAIEEAFEREIGRPLGLDAVGAAEAVLRVAALRMAGAIRLVSIARGHDPRRCALFAFGGGGPLHACAVARELAVPRIVIPPRPGVVNAIGCAIADLRHDQVHAVNRPLSDLTVETLEAALAAQREAGLAALAREAVRPAHVVVERAADMHFVGQTHLIRVPLPDGPVSLESLQADFEAAYHARFRVRLPEIHAAVASLRTAVIGERARVDLSGLLPEPDRVATPEEALIGQRRVVFGGAALLTPVYDRARLPGSAVVDGPAILRQSDTTVLVEPGDRAEGGAEGVLLVALGGAREREAA